MTTENEPELGIEECLVWAAGEYREEVAAYDVSSGLFGDGMDCVELCFHLPADEALESSVRVQLDLEQALHLSHMLRVHVDLMMISRRTRDDYRIGGAT